MRRNSLFHRFSFWGAIAFIGLALSAIKLTWNVGGAKWGGIWAGGRIGSGFLPLISGGMLILCSLLWIVKMVNEDRKDDVSSKEGDNKGLPARYNVIRYLVILPAVLLIMAKSVEYLGMNFVICVFLFIWFRFVDHFPLKSSVFYTVIIMGVLYLVFTVWLRVPFPKFFDLF